MTRIFLALTFVVLAVAGVLVIARAGKPVQPLDGTWHTETRSVEQSRTCPEALQPVLDSVVSNVEGDPVEYIVWKEIEAAQSTVTARFGEGETADGAKDTFFFPLLSEGEVIGQFELAYLTLTHVGVVTRIDISAVLRVLGAEMPETGACDLTIFADKRFIE